jgi:SAM-dependent methyltransferase
VTAPRPALSRPPRFAARPHSRYGGIERRLPAPLRRHLLHFESSIEDAVARLAGELEPGTRVLDAGAGEGRYRRYFDRQRYTGADLAIGDPQWDYGDLDCLADLAALPFPDGVFAACLNIVTLEHVPEPEAVIAELARVLGRGGRLLLVVPHEWEVHQAPHDYHRFTRYGVARLLERTGFIGVRILPVGGFFRLLSRRLLNALPFFRGIWRIPAALAFVPPALVLPLFDAMDRDRNFTLGYICTARRPS